MKSLLSRHSPLSKSDEQLHILNESSAKIRALPKFYHTLAESKSAPLKPLQMEIFQINVGKMCNQVCKHCHVDAGPDRKEIMTRETMELCLHVLKKYPSMKTVDLTGGAPEMNPNFRWFVEEISKLGRTVIDRCNLTIITANESYNDLPQFFAKHKVKVVSSLPYYQKGFTDRQRGEGVFDKSIRALKMLNDIGYGKESSGLELDLVYNPAGAFLPASQAQLQADFKKELRHLFGIEFNQLYSITNMPISRYLEYLAESGNLDDYMQKLVNVYNPAAVAGVMCRNTISVGWDGYLYDCDFNQMLEIPVEPEKVQHLRDFDLKVLESRNIRVDQHCYGCTAGSGSSCGGSIVDEGTS